MAHLNRQFADLRVISAYALIPAGLACEFSTSTANIASATLSEVV